MTKPMMVCGHSANATMHGPEGTVPACAICGTSEQRPAPDLTGRMMQCGYYGGGSGKCDGGPTPSRADAAFFEYRPNADTDYYYNGCFGWD